MTRGWTRWAAVGLVAMPALAAFARDAEPIRAGERAFGELAAGESLTIAVDAAPGTRLDVACSAWKGDDLVADLAVEGPDGTAAPFAALLTRSKDERSARIRGLLLHEGGVWRVTVAARAGTSGGFDLVTKAVRARSVRGRLDAGAHAIAFGAASGDAATLTMRSRKGATNVVRLVAPGGGETTIGAAPPVTSALAESGAFAFDVTATAPFAWKVALKPAALRKDFLDAAALAARGSISGTIRIDGEEPPPPAAAPAAKPREQPDPAIETGDVIVAFLPGKAPRDASEPVRRAVGGECEVVHALSATGPFLVRVKDLAGRRDDARRAGRTRAAVRGAAREPGVAWTATNDLVALDATPTDTLFADQLNLPQIRMPEAWDLLASRGVDGSTIPISVVDTGINPHPDLAGVYVPGYDFCTISSDGDGWDPDPTETSFVHHATFVAGVIGAVTGNASGIAGCMPRARIQPVRVIPGNFGNVFDIAAGMRWAAGIDVPGAPPNPTPCRVMNCSFGGPKNALFAQAVAEIAAKGVLVVASAGNSGTSNPQSPADEPGVLAVGALTTSLAQASYSNFGNWVDVWAPGTVLTTSVKSTGQATWEVAEGTSLSTPQATAVAALALAVNPALTPDGVTNLVTLAAGPLDGNLKLVDAAATLQYAASTLPPDPIPAALPSRLDAGRTAVGARVTLRNLGTGEIALVKPPRAVADDFGSWLTASVERVPAPLPLAVAVEFHQSGLTDGVRTGRVELETDRGTVVVPVRLVRSPPPSVGFVRVRAVRPDGSVAAQAVTSAALQWRYEIGGLADGDYGVVAEMDADGSLAVDRADEWGGAWPLADAAERVSLRRGPDVAGVDFPIRRFDASFLRSGVGGGPIRGAVAVRVLDRVSREPVAGATVHVGDALHSSVTDARGRAVVRGDFAGGVPVTVLAPGYPATTRVGADAQLQSFLLAPAAHPGTEVTVVVTGLREADATVEVEAGGALVTVAHDGSGTAEAKIAAAQRRGATAVTALVRDAGGVPTRCAFASLDATLGRSSAEVTVAAAELVAPASSAEVHVTWPDADFEAAASATTADVLAIWSGDDFPRVGGGGPPAAAFLTARWARPAALDASLVAVMRFTATDARGRVASGAFRGRLGTLLPGVEMTLPAPPAPTSPADGAVVVSGTVAFAFEPVPGAQFHQVTLTDDTDGAVWELERCTDGSAPPPVAVPAIPERVLPAGHTFRWTVRSAHVPGVSPNEWSEEGRAAETGASGVSEERTFTTK